MSKIAHIIDNKLKENFEMMETLKSHRRTLEGIRDHADEIEKLYNQLVYTPLLPSKSNGQNDVFIHFNDKCELELVVYIKMDYDDLVDGKLHQGYIAVSYEVSLFSEQLYGFVTVNSVVPNVKVKKTYHAKIPREEIEFLRKVGLIEEVTARSLTCQV
jgi:hypothetical protein